MPNLELSISDICAVPIGGGTRGAGGLLPPYFQWRGTQPLPPQNPSLMISQVSQIYIYS